MEAVEGGRGRRSGKAVWFFFFFWKANAKEIPVSGCVRAATQPGVGGVGVLPSPCPPSSILGLRWDLGMSAPLPSTNRLGRPCADASLSFPSAAPAGDGGLARV